MNEKQTDFEEQIALVVSALSDAGYDPYAQLVGYLQTGDDTFITRSRNARTIIKTLNKEQLTLYITRFTEQSYD